MLPALLRPVVLVTLLLGGGLAIAGEQLTPPMLAQQADAVAVVEVSLSPTQAGITVEQWLFGDPQPAGPDWIGPCLPGPKLLRDWHARYGNFPESQVLWKQALDAGSYRAVVVLRARSGQIGPYCETETLLAEHWTSHPRHAAWRSDLERALESRRQPAAGRCEPVWARDCPRQ